jgi:chitin synthase
MAGVRFLTFGFMPYRFHHGDIGNSSVVIHGYDYDFSNFKHPTVGPFNGQTNPLLEGAWNRAVNDVSFMLQIMNQTCLGLIQKAVNSSIAGNGNNLDWYFPCNIYNQYGTSDLDIGTPQIVTPMQRHDHSSGLWFHRDRFITVGTM